MVINISVRSIRVRVSPRHYNVDPTLLPLGNPALYLYITYYAIIVVYY